MVKMQKSKFLAKIWAFFKLKTKPIQFFLPAIFLARFSNVFIHSGFQNPSTTQKVTMTPNLGSHFSLNGVRFEKFSGCVIYGSNEVYKTIFMRINFFKTPLQPHPLVHAVLSP